MPPRGLPTLVVLAPVASSSVAPLSSASFRSATAACRSLALTASPASRRSSALLAAYCGPSSDVHSDTTDDTYSSTHRAAKTLSTRATRSRPHSKPVEAERAESRWRAGRGPGRRSWLENASRGCRVGPRRASAKKSALGREQLLYKNPAWVAYRTRKKLEPSKISRW